MTEIRNLERVKEVFDKIQNELSNVIVGQDEVVGQILVAILCNGNALLESFPGLAKTLMIKNIAKVLDLKFSRIQATPDLMPSDVLGTYLIEEDKGKKKTLLLLFQRPVLEIDGEGFNELSSDVAFHQPDIHDRILIGLEKPVEIRCSIV